MNDQSKQQENDTTLETWKEVCREVQHFNREIRNLSQKILAYFHGEDVATVLAIEVDCRNYLTAANQRHAALRRVIQDHRDNPHYSLKQVVEFEKQASDMLKSAMNAWEEMLTWVPRIPAVPGKTD